MLSQLLNSAVQDGLLTFILGLVITFLGIGIIIVFVSIAGVFFNKQKEKPAKAVEVEPATIKVEETSNKLPNHVKAAIVAAITAYYYSAEPTKKCDFVVKKIKRL